MALNTRQVSFYMAQRNKGLTQEAAAATAGISVRSGRRIEKGQWQQSGDRHWRTRQDPLEDVWLSDILPLLQSRPQISPTTVLEYLQDKYPGSILIVCAGRCSAASAPGKPATVRSGRSCSFRITSRVCGPYPILPS